MVTISGETQLTVAPEKWELTRSTVQTLAAGGAEYKVRRTQLHAATALIC